MGDDVNVCEGRLDVAVVHAIGAAVAAAIASDLSFAHVVHAGEAAGEALGKGYAAFLRESRKQDAEPKAEALDGEFLATLLAQRKYRGFDDWVFSEWTETVRSNRGATVLLLDEAKRIVDGWASASKGGI